MAKIAVRDVAQLSAAPLLAPTLEAEGAVQVSSAFERSADPIHLYVLDCGSGGQVTVRGLRRGCLVYVREGVFEVEGRQLDTGSVFVAEHGAAIRARAHSAGGKLLVFAVGDACSAAPSRRGGCAHILSSQAVPRCDDFYGDGQVGGAVFADAACPTCELWLHESTLRPHFETPLHSHNEDEIIFVIKGEVILGNRTYGPGTAIAVAQETLYAFRAGPSGLTFINFRPSQPIYVPADSAKPSMDERASYLRHMPAPVAEMLTVSPA